ncbi:MAG: tocopherol cyclase family protein [Myxococcales bacterium]|nr:tocopherol cyclase family protein [Myxococcales bacterium]
MSGEQSAARDADNAVRWRPGQFRGHVESHFLKLVSPQADRALWVKHTIFVPQGRPAEALSEDWAVWFERGRAPIGVRRSRPATKADFTRAPFAIQTEGQRLQDGAARGRLTAEGHDIVWELVWTPRGAPFRPFPLTRMYEGPFPRSKTLTPHPDVRMTGWIEIDGVRIGVAEWPGMQGHNWGASHAHAYAWAHCNAFEEESEAWFEGLSGRVRIGPVLTPWLSVAGLWIDGHLYRFDGPRAMLARRIEVDWFRWSFVLEGGDGVRLEGEIRAQREDIAALGYDNPRGERTDCLNSKLAAGTLRLRRPGAAVRELRSRAFALELGTLRRDHGVPRLL